MADNNRILAVAAGKNITESDLDHIISRYPTNKRIYFQTERGRKDLLDQKIAFTLMSTYACEQGKDKDPDFVKRIEEMKEQMLTQIVMQELFAEVSVSEAEISAFYEANKDHFKLDRTVEARHILVEDEAKAQDIANKINSGALTFEEAAKQYSSCPSKEKGGNLGYFKRGMMVKEFEEVAFNSPLHKLSAPVKTQFGYHLIEVLNETQPGAMPLAECAAKIKEQLQNNKQQLAYEHKIDELKQKYGFEKR